MVFTASSKRIKRQKNPQPTGMGILFLYVIMNKQAKDNNVLRDPLCFYFNLIFIIVNKQIPSENQFLLVIN
jgi:hypothetical protein